MDTNKLIAKALLNKSFSEAKELVFKSLYAKSSLALDEARFAVANSVFNEAKKSPATSVPAGASEKEHAKARAANPYRVRLGKGRPAGAMKEATEQLDEVSPPDMEKMTGSKKTKASFAKQYGKRGKSVMYATAWKLHSKKAGIKEGTEGEEPKDLTLDAMKKKTQKTKVGSKKSKVISYDSDGY